MQEIRWYQSRRLRRRLQPLYRGTFAVDRFEERCTSRPAHVGSFYCRAATRVRVRGQSASPRGADVWTSGHTAKHDRFRNRFNDCPRWSPEGFAAHQTGERAVARRCHPLEKRCAGRYHLREPGAAPNAKYIEWRDHSPKNWANVPLDTPVRLAWRLPRLWKPRVSKCQEPGDPQAPTIALNRTFTLDCHQSLPCRDQRQSKPLFGRPIPIKSSYPDAAAKRWIRSAR